MKILLVNGSPHEYGCTRAALDEIARDLKAQDVDSEIFWLGIEPLAGCIGCGACENLCPSRPLAAIHVEGHEVHKTI